MASIIPSDEIVGEFDPVILKVPPVLAIVGAVCSPKHKESVKLMTLS